MLDICFLIFDMTFPFACLHNTECNTIVNCTKNKEIETLFPCEWEKRSDNIVCSLACFATYCHDPIQLLALNFPSYWCQQLYRWQTMSTLYFDDGTFRQWSASKGGRYVDRQHCSVHRVHRRKQCDANRNWIIGKREKHIESLQIKCYYHP